MASREHVTWILPGDDGSRVRKPTAAGAVVPSLSYLSQLLMLVALPVIVAFTGCQSVESPEDDSSRAAPAQPQPYPPVLGASTLNAWAEPWSESPPWETTAPVTGTKWMVLTWDGASWDIILPLVEAGKMPNLASVMQNGVYGNLLTVQPTESPLIWTTVATGMRPNQHRIRGFVKSRADNTLNTAADRRVKAVWNILTELELDSLVVGFHNTFPAEPVSGLMVSNYLMQRHSFERSFGQAYELNQSYAQLVSPAEYVADVMRHHRTIDALTLDDLSRFANWTAEDFDRLSDEASQRGPGDRSEFTYLRKAYLFDTLNAEVALDFYERINPDLMLLHFQSLDWSAHYFLYHLWPDRYTDRDWPDEVVERLNADSRMYGGTIEAFYQYADEWLGRFLALRSANTGIMILSDHGFEAAPSYDRTGYHDDAPPGIFVGSGPGLRRGHKLQDAAVYDVLPTIFTLMGLAVARDWVGEPITEGLDPASSLHEIRYTDTYQTSGFSVGEADIPTEVSEEILEQLRSLGYIR